MTVRFSVASDPSLMFTFTVPFLFTERAPPEFGSSSKATNALPER